MADEKQTSARPKQQTDDDAVTQAHEDVLTPEQKRENYLADLKRLHAESVIDSSGNTPRAG